MFNIFTIIIIINKKSKAVNIESYAVDIILRLLREKIQKSIEEEEHPYEKPGDKDARN